MFNKYFWLAAIVFWTSLIYTCSDVKADECIEPISDRELLKKYKPCYGGWCLRK